jgi:hypothetical protein
MDEEVMKWGREVGFMRAIVLAARIARLHGNLDAAKEISLLSLKSHELANTSTAGTPDYEYEDRMDPEYENGRREYLEDR